MQAEINVAETVSGTSSTTKQERQISLQFLSKAASQVTDSNEDGDDGELNRLSSDDDPHRVVDNICAALKDHPSLLNNNIESKDENSDTACINSYEIVGRNTATSPENAEHADISLSQICTDLIDNAKPTESDKIKNHRSGCIEHLDITPTGTNVSCDDTIRDETIAIRDQHHFEQRQEEASEEVTAHKLNTLVTNMTLQSEATEAIDWPESTRMCLEKQQISHHCMDAEKQDNDAAAIEKIFSPTMEASGMIDSNYQPEENDRIDRINPSVDVSNPYLSQDINGNTAGYVNDGQDKASSVNATQGETDMLQSQTMFDWDDCLDDDDGDGDFEIIGHPNITNEHILIRDGNSHINTLSIELEDEEDDNWGDW